MYTLSRIHISKKDKFLYIVKTKKYSCTELDVFEIHSALIIIKKNTKMNIH